ncbi:unnamed protein product [Penicillium olsonii]|nr:unnamed protein product [Penicillium olsonii]
MVTVDAPPKSFAPFINPEELVGYDAILFGITTRFGQFPAQWTAFWDMTGEVWSSGGFWKKHAGLFVSTGTQIESGEASCIAAMSTLTHHGLVFVPVDRKAVIPHLDSPDNPHGGSRWGAGTYAGADGSRQPSELELQVAEIQGRSFYEYVANARSKA